MPREQNPSKNKAVIAGVVGGTLLLGAAGVAIYAFHSRKKQLQNALEALSRVSECSATATYYTAEEEQDDDNDNDDDDFLDCVDEAPEANKLFEEVDRLFGGNDEERSKAFDLLEKHFSSMSHNANFLWRFAKAHSMRASAEENKENMKNYILEGIKYAKRGLEVDEKNPEVHKWYAVLIGMEAEFLTSVEKFNNGKLFYEHIAFALEKRPKDAFLHYLSGRFKFELASLTWIEKMGASMLFGDLPNFTYEDALQNFKKVEKFSEKDWKLNKLMLAKCFLKMNQIDSALKTLRSAENIRSRVKEDFECDKEIRDLLKHLSR